MNAISPRSSSKLYRPRHQLDEDKRAANVLYHNWRTCAALAAYRCRRAAELVVLAVASAEASALTLRASCSWAAIDGDVYTSSATLRSRCIGITATEALESASTIARDASRTGG
jgi:hypothetical protein